MPAPVMTGQQAMAFKLKVGRFKLDKMMKVFTMKLSREVMDAPSLKVFKVGLSGALSIISSI